MKENIFTAKFTKAEILDYLSKFAEAYCDLAASDPKLFTKIFTTLHNIIHIKEKQFEELIIFPNKERERAILDYLDEAKHNVKI